MSNSSSVTDNIDPSNMLIKSAGYSTFDDINPDNPEKNSGILYNNWLNNDDELQKIKREFIKKQIFVNKIVGSNPAIPGIAETVTSIFFL